MKSIKTIKENGSKDRSIIGKVLGVLSHNSALLIISIIMASASVILQLYIPILFGDAIDTVTGKGHVDLQGLAFYLKEAAVLIVFCSILTWIMNFINNRIAYRTVREIRSRAIRKIQALPLSYLDAHSSGDIVQRVIADTDQLSDGLIMGLAQLFPGLVTIIATLIFMLSKDVIITLMVFVLTPLSFIIGKLISTYSYNMFKKQTEIRGRQTGLINEMIGSEKTVKAFGYEDRASERFRKINEELQEYSVKAVFVSSLTNPATRAVNNVIYALVALLGSWRIIGGGLTVGGLTVLLSYANQYMKPFNDITSVLTELTNSFACAKRVFELIDEEAEVDAKDLSGEKESISEPLDKDISAKEDLEIEHVFFSYDKKTPLIRDFNLKVKPGMKIALVGPTGCGKTTIINLLMRFYDIDKGSIKIGGQDIREMPRERLRSMFGMVLQDTWIKNSTVRENIAFGKKNASDDEIIRAAKEAHSFEFIKRMPKELDTVINEDDLSQGEKQLLCITRVMLLKPPILILDEATSNIDTRTEIFVQKAFDKLMEGRTSFVVAHRLSTIRNADLILVMRDGEIIESGNHEELLEKNGFYTKLYNSQFGSDQGI